MLTVPEPQYDPRFSTQAALNRGVVAHWVQERAGEVLDEWFAKGFPHKRLATEAMACAVRTGWVEGAEKIWQCGWVAKQTLLRVGWHQQPSLRTEGVDDTPMEAWLIDKTWGPNGDDREWAKGQEMARITALLCASRDRPSWDRYLGLGVNLASNAGQDLLERAMYQRFPVDVHRNTPLVEGRARAMLDHCIDGMLNLSDAQRAPLREYFIVHLLKGTKNKMWDETTREASWNVLQGLLTQTKSGLNTTELSMTLCQVALVGRVYHLDQKRLDIVRDALLRWGAPASFNARYSPVYQGHIFVAEDHEDRAFSAMHVPPITTQNLTVHVGDHWFAAPTPGKHPWMNDFVAPLTEAQQQDYRARFAALVEEAELMQTAQGQGGRRPKARKRLV